MNPKKTFQVLKVYKNPLNYYKAYFKSSLEKIRLKLWGGHVFDIRPHRSDLPTINEVYLQKIYDIALNELEEESIIIDVGAHIGSFTIKASRIAKTVYSFEPEKDNFAILKQNIQLNKSQNVVAIKKALSNYEENSFLYISPTNSGGNSLVNKFDKKQKIKTTTLTKFVNSKNLKEINLIKIDTEGYELKILRSIDKTTANKIKAIIMEFHDYQQNQGRNKIIEWLINNQFKIKQLKEHNQTTGIIYATK